MAARDVGLRGDECARPQVVDLLTDRLDGAGHLMAERHRQVGDALVRPFVPVVDVKIRATDRGAVDAHEDLVLAR